MQMDSSDMRELLGGDGADGRCREQYPATDRSKWDAVRCVGWRATSMPTSWGSSSDAEGGRVARGARRVTRCFARHERGDVRLENDRECGPMRFGRVCFGITAMALVREVTTDGTFLGE